MAKCLPVAQRDPCPNGQVDAKCVPYTGPTLPNIEVTSGQTLDVILSNINTAIGGGSPISMRIVELSLTSNDTYTLPSGGWLIGVSLSPSSSLAAFKIGTTPGGNEIIYDQLIPNTGYTTFNNSYYAGTSTTFYISGITSSTEVKLLLL